MATQHEPQFALTPIVHIASEEERKSAAFARHRYWLFANGELSREPRAMGLGIRLGADQCFIVRAGEPWGQARMVLETSLPLAGTSWQVPASATLSFVCPSTEVHRLLTRWTAAQQSGESPEAVLTADVIRELRAATNGCDETTLLAAVGVAGAGAIGTSVSAAIRRTWGLSTDLWLALREGDASREVRVDTTVRLADVEAECQVSLVVDLRPSSQSILRALALLDGDTDLQGILAEKVQRFYADHVVVDQVLDPRRRTEWRHRLEAVIQQFAGSYGCEARVLQLSELPPQMPGNLDEIVTATISDFVLPDEGPIEITLVARLRLTDPATLLRSMAPRISVTFNGEFEQIARRVLGGEAGNWTASDLQIADRDARNKVLHGQLESFAPAYGYELVRCVLATSMDPAPPLPEADILWRGCVMTAEPSVHVDMQVTVRLNYRPGARGRIPSRELQDLITQSMGRVVADRVGSRSPSEIFRQWAVSGTTRLSVHDDIKIALVALLKVYADDPIVAVVLYEYDRYLRAYDSIRRSVVTRGGIRLNDGQLIDDVTVDVYAPVIDISEQGWGELGRSFASGETWNPVAHAVSAIERLLQREFAHILRASHGAVLLKTAIVDRLRDHLASASLELFKLNIEPEIRLHPSADVMDFAKRYRRDRQLATHEFEIRDAIVKTVQAKRLERVRLIGEGLHEHPEVDEIDKILQCLQAEDALCEARLAELHRRMASEHDRLLSVVNHNHDSRPEGAV